MPADLPGMLRLILSALLARLLVAEAGRPVILEVPCSLHSPRASLPGTAGVILKHPHSPRPSRAHVQQQKAIPPANEFVSGAHGGDNAGPPSPPRQLGRPQPARSRRPSLKEMRLGPRERSNRGTTRTREDFQVRGCSNRDVPAIQTRGGRWAGAWHWVSAL